MRDMTFLAIRSVVIGDFQDPYGAVMGITALLLLRLM